MSKSTVPDWVVRAFVQSACDAGASVPTADIAQVAQELLDIWSAPERIFHNARHLLDMLTRVDILASETQYPFLVRLATWGHGLVFNISDQAVSSRNGGEDEQASVAVANEYFARIGIPEKQRERISTLIASLHKRHSVPNDSSHPDETARFDSIDIDQLALYDAHFGSLATAPQTYKTYIEQIRSEYAHVSEQEWLETRKNIVTHLLGRKRIFRTPLATEWETVARQNLSAELERIERALEVSDTCEDTKPAATVTPVNDPATELLRASEEESAASASKDAPEEKMNTDHDPDITDRIHVHVPVVKRSSLEELDEAFTPGTPPRVLHHSDAEKARRKEIADATRDTIERKHQEALAERTDEEQRTGEEQPNT